MKYRPRSFDSIDAVPIADWLRVCENNPARDLMLPGFIRAVEAGAGSFARFKHILICDAREEPVACASFSLLTLDIANVVSPAMTRFIRMLPWPLSGLFRPLILICGLPVSLGQSSVAFTKECDVNEALLLLDEISSRLSDEESAQLIVFKEFETHAAQSMDVLQTRGYSRIETPAINVFDPGFESFDAYCAALKSTYRVEVRHSLRRLAHGDAKVRVIADASEILATYTPQLHRLYLDVVAKSTIKLEVLSIDFFLELVRQFPGSVELILIENGARVLATAWTLNVGRIYYCLYLGLDYSCDKKLDLYFNVIYAALGAALKKKPERIEVGQTADTFKARLGCRRENRFAFVRGTRWLTRMLCRFGEHLVVQAPAPRKLRIYRTDPEPQPEKRDQECTTSS